MLLRLFVFLCLCHASTNAQNPDTDFDQERKTFFTHSSGFTRSQGLPSDNVLAVTLDGAGVPIAATDRGVVRFSNDHWNPVPFPGFNPHHLETVGDHLFACGQRKVAVLTDNRWMSVRQTDAPITAFTSQRGSEGVLFAAGNRVFSVSVLDSGPRLQTFVRQAPGNVLAIAAGPSGEIGIGTADGLYVGAANSRQWNELFPADDRYRWVPRDVKALAWDSQGRLCFGAQQGAGIRQPTGEWNLFTGAEGLPWNGFTMAVIGGDSSLWFGTDRGAIRRDDERFRYRFSLRWVPNDMINDIAVDDDGTAWLATPSGIARIERVPMTLRRKAELFTRQVESRHQRDGYVATSPLQEPYNPASFINGITDNDGLYTAMYGAAQAFRFAATRDPEARELARRSFEACKRLVDVTGNGFVARVIIPADWHEDVNEQYGPEYNLKKRERDPLWKLITPRFPLSRDGRYRYKVDTSSDELAGHYFFYPIYYDLVAGEEEKEEVRAVMRSMTDHLIANGFLLRDHDGLPTRWGNFSPEYLNSMRGWDQRGLNSMMMLSFLRATEHVTEDVKYAETFDNLCAEHKYDFLAMTSKTFFPPEDVVPWDNNLCLMSWYNLLRYEKDPERIIAWRLSMEHAWLHISRQKSAFWNFLYKACAEHVESLTTTDIFDGAYPELPTYAGHTLENFRSSEAHMKDSLEMLRNMPLDLINVKMDNTHRLDVRFDNTPGAQETWLDRRGTYGWHFDGRAVPIDERGHVRVDRDAFDLRLHEGDGDGRHEQEGTFFLLPYYLGLYHGFIE